MALIRSGLSKVRCGRVARRFSVVLGVIVTLAVLGRCGARAGDLAPSCKPEVGSPRAVTSPAQRARGGEVAKPSIIDRRFGFAWPDTPLGFLRLGQSYLVFSSDGARHRYAKGVERYGSVTRTEGSLDTPLGSRPPINATIAPNPDGRVNPHYATYTYIGAGPVWRVPPNRPGAGGLLAIYHAEIGKLSLLGLCRSTDLGAHWTDLGEIVRFGHRSAPGADPGFAIGTPPILLSPDGAFVRVYFQDWLAGGAVTKLSVAQTSLDALIEAAFGPRPHASPFFKFDRGRWSEPGLDGASDDLAPGWRWTGGLNAAFDDALQRYVMITSDSQNIGLAESTDGLSWSDVELLGTFGHAPVLAGYGMPVGTGPDPTVLGEDFFIYYTLIPAGWRDASVLRIQVSCRPEVAPRTIPSDE